MENTGEIDMSILDSLDKLKEHSKEIQMKWRASHIDDAGPFYIAAKSVEFISQKMKDRFQNYQKNNDKPQIVKDSLVIMLLIAKTRKMAQTDDTSESFISKILYQIGD